MTTNFEHLFAEVVECRRDSLPLMAFGYVYCVTHGGLLGRRENRVCNRGFGAILEDPQPQ